MTDIEKIESVLASTFWQTDSTICTVGPMTLSIVHLDDGYHSRMWDKEDSRIQSSNYPSPSLADAKDSMQKSVEDMLSKLRGRATP